MTGNLGGGSPWLRTATVLAALLSWNLPGDFEHLDMQQHESSATKKPARLPKHFYYHSFAYFPKRKLLSRSNRSCAPTGCRTECLIWPGVAPSSQPEK